ncbi:hypothetical protein CUT44_15505 [Streptomyces carminius]|uniref:DNA primase/polymerase bifunctional N-terminal domain-containing protein n=1 Tax=Streptomyces carminius TaxID=2665496 RepID=A0A2M8LYF7_9ACTN|nr:hypothetical protein [Streptomyces carminius]PJE96954.1 hypothetical protein CUT44_15505 [Streptomyces carminius]
MPTYSQQPRLPRATWARHLSQPELFAAGRDWDAIRVEAGTGVRAVRFLEASGVPVGPVLHGRGNGQAYFLTPPGTARGWRQKRSRAPGQGSWVALAPPGWVGGMLRWVSAPTDGPPYTAVRDLTLALTFAALEETGQ